MVAEPKPGGYSYRFDPTIFPSNDIKLDVTDTGGLELKQVLMLHMNHREIIAE
jgi:hypothetical protein